MANLLVHLTTACQLKVQEMMRREELAQLMDHSLLRPDLTADDIKKGCQEAVSYGFAAVVVNPAQVDIAVEAVRRSSVKVCSVISFPFGLSTTNAKVCETRTALTRGAQEIDMVMNYGALRSGLTELVLEDMKAVIDEARSVSRGTVVKVILENCYLTDDQKFQACTLAIRAGADFVKTSTGFGPSGATVNDVRLMRKAVGPKIGVKAAGGIRTLDEAVRMISAGANRIGTSASVSIIKSLESGSGLG
jgi:deoxyribose-phosphate aldolase